MAGGHRRARRQVKGKGRVKSREGGQVDEEEQGGEGNWQGKEARDSRGPAGTIGLVGSNVRRGPLVKDENLPG